MHYILTGSIARQVLGLTLAILALAAVGVGWLHQQLVHVSGLPQAHAVPQLVDAALVTLWGVALSTAALLLILAWWVGHVIRQRVALAQRFANDVRIGNLTSLIFDSRADEFSPLTTAMREMQESLTKVVAKVRAGAEEVSVASDEIAQANTDLSERTEQQAISLQQTTHALDTFEASVRQASDKSDAGDAIARAAVDVGVRGTEIFVSVQTTMQSIASESGKVFDIISLIDGIAFQTNILALNAAVEAARAGEQGRGFAVVAAEVRSLAQRSAQAAREVKILITGSTDRIGTGVAQVKQANERLGAIMASVEDLTQIMGEVNASSRRQRHSVGQVVNAIGIIDQGTQQNAALVEQTAAAAQQLRSQAARLVEAVNVFKLNGTATEAEAQVQHAVECIARIGSERAYQEFTHGTAFKDRDLYITVYDFHGKNLAHGANPLNVGKNLIDLQDANGVTIVKNSRDLAQRDGRGWSAPYHILNPVTQKIMVKKAFVVRVGETFVSSGIYVINFD
ncbi:MAG: methyl-accepting chemotaxis protein [Pseudomonadota bacterium]